MEEVGPKDVHPGRPHPTSSDQAMTVSDAIKPLAVSLNPERKPVTSGTATLLCHFKDGGIVSQGTHAKLVFSTTNIDGMMNKNPNLMLVLLM